MRTDKTSPRKPGVINIFGRHRDISSQTGPGGIRTAVGLAQSVAFPGVRLWLGHLAKGTGHLGFVSCATLYPVVADVARLGLLADAGHHHAVRLLAVRQSGRRFAGA